MAAVESKSKRGGSDTREGILREAERLYHEGGYQKISLEKVAEALGIQKPALFYHYKNKQELFYAMLTSMLNRMSATLSQAIEQAGPQVRPRLLAVLQRMTLEPGFDVMHFLQEDFELLSEEQKNDLRRLWLDNMFGVVQRIFTEAKQKGELKLGNVEMATYMFLNLWMLLPRVDNPMTQYRWVKTSPAEYIEEMLDLFLKGMH